ncbi:MAG: RHS repeat protein [Caulobacteraceae bacterium]|nr:RHS repeat protein [Caulobacteraceae bacterium]
MDEPRAARATPTSRKRLILAAAVALGVCLASPALANVTYTYDSLGRLASAAYDNGVTILYSYDENGNRLTRVINTNSQTSVWGSFNWGAGTW